MKDQTDSHSEIRKQQLKRRRRQGTFFLAIIGFIVLFVTVSYALTRIDSPQTPTTTASLLHAATGTQTATSTTSSTIQTSAVAATSQSSGPPAAGKLTGKIICRDPGHASNPDLGTEPIGPGSSQMKVKDPGGMALTGVRCRQSRWSAAL